VYTDVDFELGMELLSVVVVVMEEAAGPGPTSLAPDGAWATSSQIPWAQSDGVLASTT
jgi:hypothetical protein